MMLLIDNAPGHPVCSNDISENIKVIFMPPNTTAIIQPMDLIVISNFKCYLLCRTFTQLISAIDDSDEATIKNFWKDYNIKMAIKNVELAWKDVKQSCLNGVWRDIWPDCVCKENDNVDEVPAVRKELAELSRVRGFEGMEEDDIDELLSHDEALD